MSSLIGLVASGIPDDARVLVPDVEFTSLLFPFLVQQHRGVSDHARSRARASERDRPRDVDVVAFSAVQMATGEVADLDAIVAAAAAHDAITIVDATQAVGWLPLDASRFDVVVAHAYKWLMSPRGTAFMAIKPGLLATVVPDAAGWYAGDDPLQTFFGPPLRLAESARRLDTSPAWFMWVGTAPSLALIEEIGVDAIHDHDVGLANRFRAGLELEPSDSAIVFCDVEGAAEKLESADIRAAVRGGRLRTSWHVYNTDADVDRRSTSSSVATRDQPRAAARSSSQVASFTRGRPCGSPRDRSSEVDRLPAAVDDDLARAFGQHVLDDSLAAPLWKPARARVLEQSLDGLGRVLLVGADHAGRAALDPAGAVEARHRCSGLVEDASLDVRNRRGPFVERHAGNPGAAIADAPKDDAARENLASLAGHSANGAALVGLEPVLDELHRLDPVVAQDRDRRGAKAQSDRASLARRLTAAKSRRISTFRWTTFDAASSSAALAASSSSSAGSTTTSAPASSPSSPSSVDVQAA